MLTPKADEGRPFLAMKDLKSQSPVEPDRAWHVVGAQCNRADTLDHGVSSPVSFPKITACHSNSLYPGKPRLCAARMERRLRSDLRLAGRPVRVMTRAYGTLV